MNRLRWLALLMSITILGITGFQLYWLRQNYTREENSLEIRSDMLFRQTMLRLQVFKLKLDSNMLGGRTNGNLKIIMKENNQGDSRLPPREGIVSTIDVIRGKLKDSLKVSQDLKSGFIIVNESISGRSGDSIRFERRLQRPGGRGDHIYNLLYNVDSLQDSLRVTEIDSAYRKALVNAGLNIPFIIIKADPASINAEQDLNVVTIGLAHPATYRLQLGNAFPYLMKRITQPILFSILLSGITILSFVLLYKSLLRQRRLAVLKNEFISNITHELKTPIATVGVAIEALKNFNAIDNPERTKEYLDISQNELQRLGLLVDKVLKLSMFEKKELELKYETMNLKEVVEEVVSSLKLQLEKNKARAYITDEGNLDMQGDRLHLLSVVFNLIDNAVKYSKGEPSIGIDIKEKENNILLTVTDNGIGIEPAYKEKVFEKFFRVPHGDTHNAKGYGLGLSYVAQVIEKHNGTILLESQPGIGTKFIITLPKNKV